MAVQRRGIEAKPLATRMNPGGPHLGATELSLMHATDALFFNNSGSRHSYMFPATRAAPYCTVSATPGTWTTFSIAETQGSISCEYQIPWLNMHSDQIRARILWTTQNLNTTPVHLRLSMNRDLTITNTAYSAASVNQTFMPQISPPAGNWGYKFKDCYLADITADHNDDGSNFLEVIKFQATQYTLTGGDNPIATNFTPTIYLVAILLNDLYDGPSI